MPDNNINELKLSIYPLLTDKAKRLWKGLDWSGGEVGNSRIGSLVIDPNTTPISIAKFLNQRAEEHIKKF